MYDAYRSPPSGPRWFPAALRTLMLVGGAAITVAGFLAGAADAFVFGVLIASTALAWIAGRLLDRRLREGRPNRPLAVPIGGVVVLVGVVTASVTVAQRVAASERDLRENVIELPADTIVPLTAVANAELVYVSRDDDVDVIDRASGGLVATRPIGEVGPTNGLQPGLTEDETISMWHGATSDVFVRVAKVDGPTRYQIDAIWAVGADGRERWRWGEDELGDDVAIWPQAGFADGAVGVVRCVVVSEHDGWIETGCRREVIEPDGSSRWVRQLPVDPTAGGPYSALGFGLGGANELPPAWIEQETDWDFPDDGVPIRRREITHVDEVTGRARRVFDGDYYAAIGSDRIVTIAEAGDGCLLRVFDFALEPVREIESACRRDPELDGQHVLVVVGGLVAVDPWDGHPSAVVDSRSGDIVWLSDTSPPADLAYGEDYVLTGAALVHIPAYESDGPITLHLVEGTVELAQDGYLGVGIRASVSFVEVDLDRPFNDDPMYDVVVTDLATGETCGRLRVQHEPSIHDVVILPDRCAAIVEPHVGNGDDRRVYLVGEP